MDIPAQHTSFSYAQPTSQNSTVFSNPRTTDRVWLVVCGTGLGATAYWEISRVNAGVSRKDHRDDQTVDPVSSTTGQTEIVTSGHWVTAVGLSRSVTDLHSGPPDYDL
ncbi:hypothetical protein J6590_001947 [Homalodisca vitripennis]|nr:hypothetical protein J6590_001947 [Homalodisca vitripennis]